VVSRYEQTGAVAEWLNNVGDSLMSKGLDNLKHIVVLMMENRSFDHMLGFLKKENPDVQAEGPVQVFVGTRPAAIALPPLVGVIHGRSKPVIRYFLSDPGRFPGYGGYQVPANIDLSVELVGRDHNNTDLHKTWGPYTVAGGAIINLDFDL
jgi:phospholipase C